MKDPLDDTARTQTMPLRTRRKRPLHGLFVCLCMAATSNAWIHQPTRGYPAKGSSGLFIGQRLQQTALFVNGGQLPSPNDRPSISPRIKQPRQDIDATLYHYLEGIRRQLDQQQVQINRLLSIVQQQQRQQEHSAVATSFASESGFAAHNKQPKNVSKAMLFIDGTWLYYSLFERNPSECPIVARFGRYWQTRYRVNWDALPSLVQRHLQDCASPGVTVQLTKCLVYTSSRPDTSAFSARYAMFEDMQACPMMEVHQMETTGKSEKCVDLALAVDVVHLSNQYETAVLLSGDKDFLPALYRIRQSGNKVALASMQRGCNRALLTMLDIPVMWLESCLEELIVPRTDQLIPESVLAKVLMDNVPNGEQISSREVGRTLHSARVGNVSVGNEIKRVYGGLNLFVTVLSDLFVSTPRPEEEDHSFWISLQPDAHERWKQLYEDEDGSSPGVQSPRTPSRKRQSSVEKLSFAGAKGSGSAGTNTMIEHAVSSGVTMGKSTPSPQDLPKAIPDYSNFKVAELKDLCRELGLPVTGTKAALRERIDEFVASSSHGSGSPVEDYLVGLILEYLKACGGRATSRDVGRYLAANPTYDGNPVSSALQELKSRFGSLAQFVNLCEHTLVRLETGNPGDFVFEIGVRQPEEALVSTQ